MSTRTPPGTLVRVPLGKRETLGVVWDADSAPGHRRVRPRQDQSHCGRAGGHCAAECRLATTGYIYGPVLPALGRRGGLAALPPQLRELSPEQMQRRLKRNKALPAGAPGAACCRRRARPLTPRAGPRWWPQIAAQAGPFLLFGATGSGKTEVYLHACKPLLAGDPQAQALVMVPEINLTPQLEARFKARFAPLYGDDAVVSLHSGMTNPQRLKSWLAAHSGTARIVLGTRMAVFASLPHLRLIVVDEEHDPSYKSSEGARYSARDLAVYRGRLEGAKVMLGSATPSLESWHHSRPAAEGGRYLRLHMPSRIGARTTRDTCPHNRNVRATGTPDGLPLVRRVDMNHQPRNAVFSIPLLEAIKDAGGPGRAKHGVSEPARLCAGLALHRLRLEKRMPALQCLPGVPQD